jgi:hypothetical protein
MHRFGSSLLLMTVGLASLVGTSGCETQKCETDEGEEAVCAKSLTRFNGADITPDPLPYTAGTDLRVAGNYGDIQVVEGADGEVSIKLEPFNYRAYDAEIEARDELENNFDYSFTDDGDAIVVTTGRHDATNGLGADITVYLPPAFDGALVLDNDSDGAVNPGDIEADYVASAWSVDVSTDSLGDCSIDADGSVVVTRAHCDGAISVTGVADQVDVASTGLGGDVSLSLASVSGTEAGGSITSEDGDIVVSFPAGADFTVQAQSTEDGTVSASELDDDCVAATAAETAKSYTCGDGGPSFVVTAGTDGVGPSSVTLEY